MSERQEARMMAMDAERAWQAVQTRDRSQDGALFYAVRTTGVYCRPSCPSRRPARRNAEFYESAAAAAAAGYRACLRCSPDSTEGTTSERRVRRAVAYIDAHVDERITLERLGRLVGLSPFHLQRSFKDVVGLSPRAYQNARRLESMKTQLRNGADVGRAVWEAGWGSTRAAYEAAAGGLGMTPGRYRAGAPGVLIRYAVERTELGSLLVAWTSAGVCAVLLGDTGEDAVAELAAEFPRAEVCAADGAESGWIAAVLERLDGAHPGLALPLDLHGTSFQLRVWRALQEIPFGEVRSYGAIAAAIGAPGSARAVAQACASNRAALVVPCHRVVRGDGAPGGYRWGGERKRRLLEHERDAVVSPAPT
jgi:AraC family transcriptional regulator, regulatory protein of adaptative response / methylated-DNA-[protein]-cysteine methyltransferase